jgi:hypothetical protein
MGSKIELIDSYINIMNSSNYINIYLQKWTALIYICYYEELEPTSLPLRFNIYRIIHNNFNLWFYFFFIIALF